MNLFVRADSSPTVGAGHVMRCLALGQACSDRGGAVTFASPDVDSPLFTRLSAQNRLELVRLLAAPGEPDEAAETAARALERDAEWVALDGYHFDEGYQERIKSSDLRLLVLDDFGHARFDPADVVLNQNLHADARQYEPRPPGDLLLGPRYALLRREFTAWREWRREIPARADKILVTLGGGELGDAVAAVLGSLIGLERADLRVRCLVGPLADETSELLRIAEQASFEISFESPVVEMPELMAWADAAVSGGGTTCWELAFMGLPSLTLAHNTHQEEIARSLEAAGVALYAGTSEGVRQRQLAPLLTELLGDAALRRRMSSLGRQLVDGRGAERVIRELETRLDGGHS